MKEIDDYINSRVWEIVDPQDKWFKQKVKIVGTYGRNRGFLMENEKGERRTGIRISQLSIITDDTDEDNTFGIIFAFIMATWAILATIHYL